MCQDGLAEAMRAGAIVAATGHSQGLLCALLVAEAGPRDVDDALLSRYVRLAWAVGAHAAPHARPAAAGPAGQAPMATISGVRMDRLTALLDAVNGDVAPHEAASIALVNTRERVVVAGPAATLGLLRARLTARERAEAEERRRGRRGGAPLRAVWSDLEVDVAFHTPALAAPCERLGEWLAAHPRTLPAPGALRLPVLSPSDGYDLREAGDLAAAVAREQLLAPVRWDLVCRRIAGHGADWVLDLGPGTDVARLAARTSAATAPVRSRWPPPRGGGC